MISCRLAFSMLSSCFRGFLYIEAWTVLDHRYHVISPTTKKWVSLFQRPLIHPQDLPGLKGKRYRVKVKVRKHILKTQTLTD
jgi:hypothetical protein